ncbi:symmetrical bis(5'-nucleosyl)-tetraphosphatase [Vibrio sonorensis]|uniref:symmetrical bis(5'-nucleosyl)-tetraphosphatase n=1 Tax=Vibrio sonorensis TaxID=1004316 RepID=UPI0008D8DDD3|nr:symmetrical bis(5'-nucleosyl)-tetraphosphatase [Vibrio sonorensis]
MATYIVGDIQGCFDELILLLEKARFNHDSDQLYIAGDLVARGPKSLETLRFAMKHKDSIHCVLGNHDLHLLAVSLGIHKVKSKDKTAPILQADDREALLTWLRRQPLLIEKDDFIICHAGVSPLWDLEQTRESAKEIESILSSERWNWLIENMYDNQPDQWSDNLTGIERYRYIINAFTRMRFCFPDGRLDMQCKLPPTEVSKDELLPWFEVPNRKPIGKTILFGHWAALEGYHSEGLIGLDTGCVWGGELTMIRWEDKQIFTQPAIS